jgi:hypothetical protein
MKTSPKIQQIIQKLAAKHGVNLGEVGASLQLDMPRYDSLYIRRISSSIISVAHRFESQGVFVPDPEILFFTGQRGKWIAIHITQSVGGNRTYARLNDDFTKIVGYHIAAQQP